mgnify:CR=1 FL=1
MIDRSSWRAGSPCPDAPLNGGFLLDQLGTEFVLLGINAEVPDEVEFDGIKIRGLSVASADDPTGAIEERYLGSETQAVYLIRPDQHVTSRGRTYHEDAIKLALRQACGKE